MVERGLHVRLVEARALVVVAAVEPYACVDLCDGRVDVADGLITVAALVVRGRVKFCARLLKVCARGLHARLVCDEGRNDGGGQQQSDGAKDSLSAPHGGRSLLKLGLLGTSARGSYGGKRAGNYHSLTLVTSSKLKIG